MLTLAVAVALPAIALAAPSVGPMAGHTRDCSCHATPATNTAKAKDKAPEAINWGEYFQSRM